MMNHFARFTLLVATLAMFAHGYAANVMWGNGSMDDTGWWGFKFESPNYEEAFPNMAFETTVRYRDVLLAADYDALIMAAWASAFAVMSEGDVVDSVSMRANKSFYDTKGVSLEGVGRDGTVTIPKGGSVYFGFETDLFLPGVGDVAGYGWVKFSVDSLGKLDSFETAIDLDGGPMIVGGGSAIPEPHSGLLLLVGGALLALRRRRWDTRFQILARIRSEQVRQETTG